MEDKKFGTLITSQEYDFISHTPVELEGRIVDYLFPDLPTHGVFFIPGTLGGIDISEVGSLVLATLNGI